MSSAEELLRDADIALYAAKEAGKDRYVVFESEMQTELRSRHELEMDLQAAIGTDQFFLLYQPIFDLADMSVVGVEALLRWHHPTRGLLQPTSSSPPSKARASSSPSVAGCSTRPAARPWRGGRRDRSPRCR